MNSDYYFLKFRVQSISNRITKLKNISITQNYQLDMASKYLQKFPVPPGFQQILSDFTKEVLRDQPQSIAEYAAKYFEMMQKGQKFEFNSKYNVRKEDKKHQLSYNPKKAEQITKKAAGISASIGSWPQAQSNERTVDKKNEQVELVQQQQQQHQEQYSIERPHQSQQSQKHSDQELMQNQSERQKDEFQQVKKYGVQKQVQKFLDELSVRIQKKARSQGQSRIGKIRQLVDRIFPDFDKDGSGFLEEKQIPLFVKAILVVLTHKAEVEVTEETIKTFKMMSDQNKDGKISKKQLQNFVRFHIGELI